MANTRNIDIGTTGLIDDDAAIASFNYKPELKRRLGAFGSFAVAYSFISITMGIFSNYGYVLKESGPVGIWTWILVAVGQTFVAAIFAEMAGRIPLSGYSYQWVGRLAGRGMGWITGMIALCNLCFSGLAVNTVCAPLIAGLFGMTVTPHAQTIIVITLLSLQYILNAFQIRFAARVNNLAVFTEIASIVGLTVLLVAAMIIHGEWHPELLVTQQTPAAGPYWPHFLLAMLLGSWALVGFESAADVAEETVNARRNVPHAIIRSLVVSAILGFIVIVILTLAIPDLGTIANSDSPIISILEHYWGQTVATGFTALVALSIFACGMLLFTIASRLIFAMARDKAFPASGVFSHVSPLGVPRNAVTLVYIVSIILALFADQLTSLLAASSILFAMVYLITIATYAVKADSLPPTDSFSLKRGRKPIIAMAIIWLVAELGILTVPPEFHDGALAAGGVCIGSVLLYLAFYRKQFAKSAPL